MSKRPFADVLIVCGQGVYEHGRFFCEFHDREVFLEHAIAVHDLVSRYHYTDVVCSGGFTKEKAPNRSEAESFLTLWKDTHHPPSFAVTLDEVSLDSAENLLYGLMEARCHLEETPIRRIGIFAAWEFKKWRFTSVAESLGIHEQFYFHGHAGPERSNTTVPPFLARSIDTEEWQQEFDNHSFLLSPHWEEKRRRRWQRNSRALKKQGFDTFEERFALLKPRFPETFRCISKIREAVADGVSTREQLVAQAAYRQLPQVFRDEVMYRYNPLH